MTPVGVPDPAEVEALAEWLGAMNEARNVFDLTDEATTVISIDVDVLAERIADHDRTRDRELGERIAAAIEGATLDATWLSDSEARGWWKGNAVAAAIARAESERARQHTGTEGE